jgi:hypothetical protein
VPPAMSLHIDFAPPNAKLPFGAPVWRSKAFRKAPLMSVGLERRYRSYRWAEIQGAALLVDEHAEHRATGGGARRDELLRLPAGATFTTPPRLRLPT